MSKQLATTVLSAAKTTAIMVSTMKDSETVYVYRASDYDMLASVSIEYDELFEEAYYYVTPHWNYGGPKQVARNTEELKTALESLKGYPTDADNHRNYSRSVYKETSY